MGDPPKLRNKYEKPKMLWDEDRLNEEKTYKKDYGLKNMRELWVCVALLKKYRREARRLLSVSEEVRLNSQVKILSKVARLGILKEGATLDDILSLSVKDILERRLQTIVKRQGLAKSMAQSRQLVSHGFISVKGRKVTSPSYIVTVEEEGMLGYAKEINLQVKPTTEITKVDQTTATEPKVN